MSLTRPEDRPIVDASAIEFLKICEKNGIQPEQIIQVAIAVAAAAVKDEAKRDRKYALELYERFTKSLRTAILSQF